jgi:acetyl-CoA carboxylase biotin carboxyl carrier protein
LNNKRKTGKSKSSSLPASSASSKGRAGGSGSPMDVDLLEQIVKLMASNDLNTVDVRDGDKRVILRRGAQFVAAHGSAGVYASAPQAAPASHAPSPGLASGAASGAGGASGADDDAGLTPIKSPMVGTFYAAPSPDAKPFVSVGSRVDEETDVCVIEAMKVFNNIKAECRGSIAKVLVNNGETVEFGQTLFLVKP